MNNLKKTKDVFGIQRKLPLNYIVRDADQILIDSLDRDHHVVIYGSSKQGKTSLRNRNIEESEYILIHCNNNWNIENINTNILKQAGYQITLSDKRAVSGNSKIKATLGLNLFSKLEGEKEKGKSHSHEVEKKELEIDPEDVNDIILALNSINFNKLIVLEDFHYLKPEAQKDFAVELKAFHENSNFTFIIVGVWLEENRLIALNGDLSGRVKSVNADRWKKEELEELISDGEALLNISFTSNIKDRLIESSLQNVHIVQEVCYSLCINNNVTETVQGENKLLDCNDIENIITTVINQHAGRYNNFIISFSQGFQSTELEMYKWLLYALLTSSLSNQEEGLKRAEIKKVLTEKHPRGEALNDGNITQSLNSVASLQIKKNITPIIIDYDSANLRLNVVDKGFLIWLHNQKLEEVLTNAGLPTQ